MIPSFLHSKPSIEAYLRREPYLHLYELGDLDDFFWPYTTWFADTDGPNGEAVRSLFLMYNGGGLPVILALGEGSQNSLRELLQASLPLLPRRFYAHLSGGLAEVLQAGGYKLDPRGRLWKMGLIEPDRLEVYLPGAGTQANAGDAVVQLGPADEPALRALYAAAYAENWFDPRMLETGCYYGIWRDGAIVSVAGIHVYSPAYRAAALGNITTHPDWRRRGLAARVTAELCRALRESCDTIGLNVRAANRTALSVYRRLGFRQVAEYEEYMVTS